MTPDAIRAAALLAAASSHAGQALPQADLITYAGPFIPWITGVATLTQTLTIKGASMPLTVDSAGAVAILGFEDDHQDPVSAPAGAIATATSSDTAVLTVGAGTMVTNAAGLEEIHFPLGAVAEGTSVLSVHATAADGSPLLGPSGTAIADAAPVTVTVAPGAPAAEVFTVPGN